MANAPTIRLAATAAALLFSALIPGSAAAAGRDRAYELVSFPNAAGQGMGLGASRNTTDRPFGRPTVSADGQRVVIGSRLPIDGQASGGVNQLWAAQRSASGWAHEYVGLPARRASYDANQSMLSYTADFRASLWGTLGAQGQDPADPTQIVVPPSPGFGPTSLGVLRRNADGTSSEQLRGPAPQTTSGAFQVSQAAISADGRTSTFYIAGARLVAAGDINGGIYQRTGSEAPRLISVDEQGNSLAAGQLLAVSDDSTRALFTTTNADNRLWTASTGRSTVIPGLTSDARLGFADPDLTRLVFTRFGGLVSYDVSSGTVSSLTTSDTPNVITPGITGQRSDGTIYFSTADVLGGAAGAQQGETNIYRLAFGSSQPEFVASAPAGEFVQGRVLDDGALLFVVRAVIGGNGASGVKSAFRWSPAGGPVQCLSCPRSGPVTAIDTNLDESAPLGDYPTRYGTSDGRYVYFGTPQRLVARDTNSVVDVYEVDTVTGQPTLITPGDGAASSYFQGVGADGKDVFFTSRQKLVAGDQNGDAYRVYDARIGGGFPGGAGSAPCSGDSCRGPLPALPPVPLAATVGFGGPGNVAAPAPKVKVAAIRGAVRGYRFALKVRAPGRGTLRVSGTGLNAVSRRASRAATYRLTVRLTAAGRRKLARAGRLRVRAKVRFAPSRGASSTATVPVTLRKP